MAQNALTDDEIAQAEAVNISDIARERGIPFDRKGDHDGPCPRCGGTVPDGGRVRPADAREIIQQREIAVADSGLFCDFQQSWRYVRHA